MTGCASKQQKQTNQAQTDLAKQQTATSEYGLQQLKSSLPDVTNFFKALLSGDSTTVMKAIGPEVSTLTSEYESAGKASAEFAPRGGGRTASLEEAPFTEAADITKLVEGAQTEGATGLLEIDQLLSQLTVGSGSAASSTLDSLATSLNEQKKQQTEGAGALGAAAGSLIALLVGA